MLHYGSGLDVEVTQHFVRAPTANQADAVSIDVGAEKGHSTGSSKGACGDVLWQKTKLGPKEPRGSAEVGGEVRGREKFPRSGGGVPIGSQRKRCRSRMCAKVQNTTGSSSDRAEGRVATEALANNLPSDAILLCSEFEGHKSSREEALGRSSAGVQPHPTKKECGVGEAEGGRFSASAGILAGA
eukprot:scaffold7072_cov167-Cylindrotheca_fusiformis.AAC.1